MKIRNQISLLVAGVVLTSGNAFAAREAKSEKSELGAVIYRYNMGNSVAVVIKPNQHVICDTCPETRMLAEYKEPVVNKLKLNPMPQVGMKEKESPGEKEKVTTAQPQKKGEVAKDTRLATIQFKLDSSRLDKKALAEIASLAKELKGKTINSDMQIKVDGYTCKLGTKKHNSKLSERRAIAVAEELKRKGIKVIQTNGEGDCCYVDDKHLEPNRRVEILESVKKGDK